jgi:uncharacterized membrane protein YphA (DoxX/SURF4 family)
MNAQQNRADLVGRVLIAGGFLFLVARGPGAWSLDARRDGLATAEARRS